MPLEIGKTIMGQEIETKENNMKLGLAKLFEQPIVANTPRDAKEYFEKNKEHLSAVVRATLAARKEFLETVRKARDKSPGHLAVWREMLNPLVALWSDQKVIAESREALISLIKRLPISDQASTAEVLTALAQETDKDRNLVPLVDLMALLRVRLSEVLPVFLPASGRIGTGFPQPLASWGFATGPEVNEKASVHESDLASAVGSFLREQLWQRSLEYLSE